MFGGTIASPDRYPWFCFFTKPNSPHPFCGGVLIAPDTILSAGHCDIRTNDLVYIGGPIGGPKTEVRAVKSTTSPRGPDTRVVRLYTPSTKPPIKMATQLPPNNTPVALLGRGRKSGNQRVVNRDFTVAYVSYVDGPTAFKYMQEEKEDSIRQLLPMAQSPAIVTVVSPDRGGCLGDSGGPLILERGPGRDELLGVQAFIANPGEGRACEMIGTKRKYTFCSSIPHYLKSTAPRSSGYNNAPSVSKPQVVSKARIPRAQIPKSPVPSAQGVSTAMFVRR